ncbi:MAG: PKD domain-containing protein [Thermoplasmata archaeon]|nr:MAG: PKD domain-containing protein [Thermoplasmata archaeon]
MEKLRRILSMFVSVMMVALAFSAVISSNVKAEGLRVEIISPKDDIWVTTNTVKFYWAIINLEKQDKVEFYINGVKEKTVYYGPDRSTTYYWENFPEGPHFQWYIMVYNKVGDYYWHYGTSDIAYFRHDSIPPGTPVPDDGVSRWTNDNTPTFTWSPVSETGSGIEGYNWNLDGQITYETEDFFTGIEGPFPPPGWSTDDWRKSEGSSSGGEPPEAHIAWPFLDHNQAYLRSPPIDTSGMSSLTMTFKSEFWSPAGGCYCWVRTRANPDDLWSDVTPWPNPIGPGGVGPTSYSINIDHDIGEGTQVKFEVYASNPFWQLGYWVLDDVYPFRAEPPSPALWVTLPPIPDGIYTFNVRAKDHASNVGNYGSDTFGVDTIAPEIFDYQLGDDNWRNTGGTTYNIDFSDTTTGSGLHYAQYKITSAPFQGGSVRRDWTDIFRNSGTGTFIYTTDWGIDYNSCEPGINYISVRTSDFAGNTEMVTDAYYVLKDTISPAVTWPDDDITGPSADKTPTFFWNPPYDGHWLGSSGIAGYYWKVDGGAWDWTPNSWISVLFSVSDGTHTFYVKAQDNAGNVGNEGWHVFEIDSKPTADAGGPYEAEEGMPVMFDASLSFDPGNDQLGYRWDFENDGVWDTPYSNRPTASHTWYDDHAGTVLVEVHDNIDEPYYDIDTATVTISNVVPTVYLCSDITINEGDTVHFSAGVTDPGTLDTHTYQWDFGDGTKTEIKLLIADMGNNRIVEVDREYNVEEIITGLSTPTDVEKLDNGNLLITELFGSVMEMQYDGTVVWEYGDLYFPIDAERLDDGNTLIADQHNNRVIELDHEDKIVWWAEDNLWNTDITYLYYPSDVERLGNGNTLIVDMYNDRLIEVTEEYEVVWESTYQGALSFQDMERPDNDITLVCSGSPGFNKVYEVDSDFNELWSYPGAFPSDAERLPNGHTLVVEYLGNRIFEVARNGTVMWEMDGLRYPYDVEILPATESPSHIFSEDGVYTVTLTVTDDDGGVGYDTMTVTVNNVAPQVNLGEDIAINEGETVFFCPYVVDPGNDSLTYDWDFGDGGGSTEPKPIYMYEDDGIFTVTLSVTDEDGAYKTVTTTVTVLNVDPTVYLGDDVTINEGDSVLLNALASDPSPMDILNFYWDLDNDGFYDDATGTQIILIYNDNGLHTVSVMVTDSDGGSNIEDVVITVLNVAPLADASVSQNIVDEGTSLNFYATQFDLGADTFTYLWEFDDGDTSTEQNPIHTYADNGVYTVTLTITDDDGGVGTDTIVITVNNVAPTAIASVDQNPVDEGVILTFTGGQTDPGSDTFTYFWDFGDGGTSTLQSPDYEYLDNGIYAVTFSVTDDDGDWDITWIIMVINDLGPTADAGPDKSVTIIDVVDFSGSGSTSYPDAFVLYEWDFGDGNSAIGVDVSHTFGEIGTYTVILTVTDDDGSTHSDTATVISLAPGVELISSDITFSPLSPVDVGEPVMITAQITNYGSTDASNVIVSFYDGNPDENGDGVPDIGVQKIGGDIEFPTIASGETVGAFVMWISTFGYHDIYVWADPENNILEYDDTNNQDFDFMVVGPDLIPLNLVFTPESPVAVGETITIYVDVKNNGGTGVTGVLVRFYDENPDKNGDGLEDANVDGFEEVVIPVLGPGETVTVWVEWIPADVGNYDLCVWIDPPVQSQPNGLIEEAIESNNLISDIMSVGPDLTIDFTDIIFSENPVEEGTLVTITAVINNIGRQDAHDVIVNFYDNDILPPYIIGSEEITMIEAGGSATVTIEYITLGKEGYHDIWVVIDEDNAIDEYDETNNQAYNVLNVI